MRGLHGERRTDEDLNFPDIQIDIHCEANPQPNCEMHRETSALLQASFARQHKTLTFADEIAAAQLQFSQVSFAFFAMPRLTAGE